MTDDMVTAKKQLLDNTSGKGLCDYTILGFSNHIDYEKWNNYMRYLSIGRIFTVMGQFFGCSKEQRDIHHLQVTWLPELRGTSCSNIQSYEKLFQ